MPQNAGAIAIIGIGCRLPGARNAAEFWQNLAAGVESIARFQDFELEDAWGGEVRGSPAYVRARPILEQVEEFDSEFFGMQPQESALTDPQHRVFLECAWEALEDAGHDPARFAGSVGVYAGCSPNTYFLHHVCADRGRIEEFTSAYQAQAESVLAAAAPDFLAPRVAHRLNLHGPAVTVQSAGATSLLAVAQACQGLLSQQCDMALAGGVSISFPQRRGYLHGDDAWGSADGHCRAFDAKASGTVWGSGAGAVLLRRLDDALADGDHVYAVIRGCGVTSDGAPRPGMSAASVDGQAAAIERALASAGADARSVSYVECHGTAMPQEDPVEIAALTRAFRGHTAERGFCAVGSVKGNIGHLEAAAGIASLIKTALALERRQLPPSLHFTAPNPQIDFAQSPFFVNTQLGPWPESQPLRRAGVSSFGAGGNVHLIVEQAPTVAQAANDADEAPQVLPVSARSGRALAQASAALAAHLRSHPELPLAAVAQTLQTGRRHFAWRAAPVCRSHAEACESLEAIASGEASAARGEAAPGRSAAEHGAATGDPPPIVFMFPGHGAQHTAMARGVYRRRAEFRRHFDRCAELLAPALGADLRALMLPETPALAELLGSAAVVQPALFSIGYSLAQLWMSWGVRPAALIGHSVGEFVCAVIAGVMSLEDALSLVAARSRLLEALPPGAMLAVRASEAQVIPLLPPGLTIAAINGFALCVVSGPVDAIDACHGRLAAEGIGARRLAGARALHSPMIEPIVSPFRALIERVHLSAPSLPFISCVSGDWIRPEQSISADYWASQVREPVRFADGVGTVCRSMQAALLECGPGSSLGLLARLATCDPAPRTIASLLGPGAPADDDDGTAAALAQLWTLGVEPDWMAVHGMRHPRLPLPTYPFERRRCWIDPPRRNLQHERRHAAGGVSGTT